MSSDGPLAEVWGALLGGAAAKTGGVTAHVDPAPPERRRGAWRRLEVGTGPVVVARYVPKAGTVLESRGTSYTHALEVERTHLTVMLLDGWARMGAMEEWVTALIGYEPGG